MHDTELRPEDDPGWHAYARTVLEFHLPGRPRVDLALPLDAAARATFLLAGLPGAFGLITPENPRGHDATTTVNEERWQRFRAGPGHGKVRVDGHDPHSSRHERGVAMVRPRDQLLQLAREWGQSAIYWYDGDLMWVVGALTIAPPWPLGPGR